MTSIYIAIVSAGLLLVALFAHTPRPIFKADAPAAQTLSMNSNQIAVQGELIAYQLLYYHQAATTASRATSACDSAVCELSISGASVKSALNDVFADLENFSGEDGFQSATSQAGGSWFVLSWATGDQALQNAIRTSIAKLDVSTSMVGVVQADSSIVLLNGSAFGGTTPTDVPEGTTVRIGFK